MFALYANAESEDEQANKKKRSLFGWGYGNNPQFPYYRNGYGLWNPWNSNRGFPIPFWNLYYPPGVGNVWNVPQFGFFDFQLPPFSGALPPTPSTAIKPVTEPSLEPPPPQVPPRPKVSVARPITPQFSATPPAGSKQNRPVSLGSGSLGVVQLADGGFTLGSGSIGYSPIGPPQPQSPPMAQPTAAAIQMSSPGSLDNNVDAPQPVPFSLPPLEALLPPNTSPQYAPPTGQVQSPVRQSGAQQPVLIDSYAKIRYEAEGFANGNQIASGGAQLQTEENYRTTNAGVGPTPPETRGYSSTVGLSGYS